ncbi:MAG: hypothetical protein AVDCRST_MAG41-3611, partial [uncultured Corynebacteriales bacterium]
AREDPDRAGRGGGHAGRRRAGGGDQERGAGRRRSPVRGAVAVLRPDLDRPEVQRPGRLGELLRHAGQPDGRGDRRALHVPHRHGRRADPGQHRRHRRVDQLRGGAGLQHPAAQLDLRAGRQPGAVRGVVGRAERLLRVGPGHRLHPPRLRRLGVLHPRPRRAGAQRAGGPARVRAAADPRAPRHAVRREQAAALHGRRVRPGGRGPEDLVRRGHPAASGPAAGEPDRRGRHRRRRVGEVLQQRGHRRHLLRRLRRADLRGRDEHPDRGQLVRQELDLLRHDRRVPPGPGRRPRLPGHLRHHAV